MKNIDISDFEIEMVNNVLEDHTVFPLTREGALESLLYCIASQALPWERASDFVYGLREGENGYSSWEKLTDKDFVNSIAKKII